MAIIKLKKGEAVRFTVTSVVPEVPSTNQKYGPSTKFVGHTPDDPDACIFMTPSSAERQLSRIGHTLESVVGHTVEFAKPGDYVDINALKEHTPAPTTGAAKAPATKGASAKQGFTSGAAIAGLDDVADGREGHGHADERAAQGSGATANTADMKATQWARLRALHKKCLEHVLSEEAPLLTKQDIGWTPEAVSALTAQLFIAATNAGLHR